jgi:hypothetical protein
MNGYSTKKEEIDKKKKKIAKQKYCYDDDNGNTIAIRMLFQTSENVLPF